MRKIIIVGAGGLGRELHYWMKQGISPNDKIIGFLSSSAQDLECYPQLPPYLGAIESYNPKNENEEVIVAIGDIEARKRIALSLKERGAKFYTFIHPSSVVTETVKIGEGCIIGPLCTVSNDAVLCDQVVLNTHCVVGHDAKIGSFSVLSPMSGIMGGVEIAEEVFLGANVTIAPRIKVGRGAKVSAGVAVFRDIPDYTLVAGPLPKSMTLQG